MKYFIRTVSVIAIVAIACAMLPTKQASADFLANRIIDDAVFDNANAMNAAQIDGFLNQFPNSCISPNSGFDAVVPNGYNPNEGFKYSSTYGTAGTIIAASAQVYGINPQVLLVTLEKEQSLVTGRSITTYCNNGDQHKYAAAVGYGCPDSGTTHSYSGLNLYRRNGVNVTETGTTCVNSASKAGFAQQVIRAAWLLKFGEQRSKGNVGWAVIQGSWDNSDDPQSCYGGPMIEGTFARCPSGGATYYDGYITIDNTAVHIETGGTAALYWYTPHFHGNQNFSTLFTQWFGNPTFVCGPSEVPMPQVVSLYNPQTYHHFYTAYRCEANAVGFNLKFQYEGAAFNTTDPNIPGSVPVWRLYKAATSDHMWSTDQGEINFLTQRGYTLEGLAFHTAPPNAAQAVVWRLYNPTTYQHVWTLSQDVINAATQKGGYKVEGVAFYSQ